MSEKDTTVTRPVVVGVSAEDAENIRSVLNLLNPPKMPSAIVFVPTPQYLAARKGYGLKTPRDSTDNMFTHIPSGRIFVDAGKYNPSDQKNLWYWLSHELAPRGASLDS